MTNLSNRVFFWITMVLVVIVVSYAWLPRTDRKLRFDSVKSVAIIRTLAADVYKYANSHNGKYPDSLELVPEIHDWRNDDLKVFTYLGKGKTQHDIPICPILIQSADFDSVQTNTRFVFFSDGTSSFVEKSQLAN